MFNNDDLRFAGARKSERRAKRRFKIEQPVRYKLLYGPRLAETGSGMCRDISSSGIYITTDKTLTTGLPVELSMTWPALLNDNCPMKLMIFGCVVRADEHGAAISIERYEFRTQGKSFELPIPLGQTVPAPSY